MIHREVIRILKKVGFIVDNLMRVIIFYIPPFFLNKRWYILLTDCYLLSDHDHDH